MNQVQSFDRVSSLDHTRDVDLARALGDHLDVHTPLGESREHASCYAYKVTHLLADEGEDGHLSVDGDLWMECSQRGLERSNSRNNVPCRSSSDP
jgi:hypothetical protein